MVILPVQYKIQHADTELSKTNYPPSHFTVLAKCISTDQMCFHLDTEGGKLVELCSTKLCC